jgi:hypothetical protein
MQIGKHIGLVWQYGKWIILAGQLFNVACSALLAGAFSYGVLVGVWVLKLMYTAVVLYLRRLLEDRDAIFFYINLGWSRKCLMAWTLGIDFGLLILMEIVIALCQ